MAWSHGRHIMASGGRNSKENLSAVKEKVRRTKTVEIQSIGYAIGRKRESTVKLRCCQCQANRLCVRCVCVQAGRHCVDCYPSRNSPSTGASQSTCANQSSRKKKRLPVNRLVILVMRRLFFRRYLRHNQSPTTAQTREESVVCPHQRQADYWWWLVALQSKAQFVDLVLLFMLERANESLRP